MARKSIPNKLENIDREAFRAAASAWCNYRELAAIFQVSEPALHQNAEFKEIIERARANTKQSIRKKQLELALEGNVSMLIWLGKNMLKQSELGPLDESESPKSFLPPVAELDPRCNEI